jgi:hypothetical protein
VNQDLGTLNPRISRRIESSQDALGAGLVERMANREKREGNVERRPIGKRQEDVTEQEEQATDADSSMGTGSPIQEISAGKGAEVVGCACDS